MDKTAAAGWPGIRLSELGDTGDTAAAATTPVRPSPAASAAEDEDMLVSCCLGGGGELDVHVACHTDTVLTA